LSVGNRRGAKGDKLEHAVEGPELVRSGGEAAEEGGLAAESEPGGEEEVPLADADRAENPEAEAASAVQRRHASKLAGGAQRQEAGVCDGRNDPGSPFGGGEEGVLVHLLGQQPQRRAAGLRSLRPQGRGPGKES